MDKYRIFKGSGRDPWMVALRPGDFADWHVIGRAPSWLLAMKLIEYRENKLERIRHIDACS